MPLPGQATTTPQTRAEKGLAVQKQIVGSDRVEQLYATAPADEQHIQRYLSANCFGDYLWGQVICRRARYNEDP